MAEPLLPSMPPPPRALGLRVLLVDDEVSVCQSMGRILTRVGYDVTVARSGPEALAAIAGAEFAAVVTDHNMPGMSGGELIDRILAEAPHLREHIIITSGNLQTDETQALVARTGCLALEKPFRLSDLADAVTRATQGVKSPR